MSTGPNPVRLVERHPAADPIHEKIANRRRPAIEWRIHEVIGLPRIAV